MVRMRRNREESVCERGRGILGLDIVILLLSLFLVGMTTARFM